MEKTPSPADLVRAINSLLEELFSSPTRVSSLLLGRGLSPVICRHIAADYQLLGRFLANFRQLLYLELVRVTSHENATAVFKLYGLDDGTPDPIDRASALLGVSAERLSALVDYSLGRLKQIAADGTIADIALASALGKWPSSDTEISALDPTLQYPPPLSPRDARSLFAPYAHIISQVLPGDSTGPAAPGSRHSSPTQLTGWWYDYSTTDLEGLQSDDYLLF